MLGIAAIVPEEQRLFLSSLSPGPAQKQLAVAVVVGILVVFVVITVGLLSGMQTARIDAFLPAYLTAMFVCDSITAILLYTLYPGPWAFASAILIGFLAASTAPLMLLMAQQLMASRAGLASGRRKYTPIGMRLLFGCWGFSSKPTIR